MKKLLVGFLSLSIILFAPSCGGDEKKEDPKIDPANGEALSRALQISGNVQSGAPPVPTFTSTTPSITNSQSSASVTSNNTLFVPFTVTSTNGFSGIYLLIDGATSYWQIPLTGSSGNGQVVLPVGIPGNVLTGNFTAYYCLYTSSGDVSAIEQIDVEIVDLENSCEFGTIYESGSDGLTIRSYSFGASGAITMNYDTYSAQDRIDVFVNGTWVDGTGPSLASGQTPPASICGDGAPGFVGEIGTLNFNYTAGQRIDVYVSGCFGGTAWDYNFDCP